VQYRPDDVWGIVAHPGEEIGIGVSKLDAETVGLKAVCH
jgi:hypothetical protein